MTPWQRALRAPGTSEGQVSVVLPVYNQAQYLPEALDSVFAQTYPLVELIVVNDGSTDDTARVLAEYQARHSFTLITQENQGLPRALNRGFAAAHGQFLTWTSSDNIMLPEMLSVLVTALRDDPSVGLVYADFTLIDEHGVEIGLLSAPEYDPYLLLHSNLIHCCFLYRRECMERLGGYSPEFVYSEDWEYWIRLSRYYRMKHIPGVLYRYRFHSTSMTSEIVRGTARGVGFAQFSSYLRRNMPLRWWIGKVKWWYARFIRRDSPLSQGRLSLRAMAEQAASRCHGD